MTAVVQRDIKKIEELVLAGVDVNAFNENGETALYISVSSRVMTVTRLLIELGADPNMRAEYDDCTPTALAEAIIRCCPEIVAFLIEVGADPELLVDSLTPLMIAADSNCLEAAKILLQAGVDVNARTEEGVTALFFAAQNGHTKMMQLLQDLGATGDYSQVLEDFRNRDF